MVVYYTVGGILAFSSLFQFTLNKKHQNILLWALVIFLTLFSGLRWNTGSDWYQYLDNFNHFRWDNIFSYYRYGNVLMEPGFVFLGFFIKYIFKTFYWYNILTSLFIFYSSKRISQKTEYPLIVFAFLTIGNWFFVRAGLAIGISYWIWYYVIEDKPLKALIPLFFAFTIHTASIISILIIIIYKFNLKINYKLFILLFIFVGTSSYLLHDYLQMFAAAYTDTFNFTEKIEIYSSYDSKDTGENIRGGILNFLIISFFFFCRNLIPEDKKKIYNCLLISTILASLIQIVFSTNMAELRRLASYFIASKYILFAYTTYLIRKSKPSLFFPYIVFIYVYMIWQVAKVCDGYYFKEVNVPYKTIYDYGMSLF